ncbi:MAG: hypothetical protein EOP87_14505 [Verrucomicrobiaceae bacterium]|nr:MAG: hypothetical protein EOP87_14505 [Verrucomicrobiaceae bacterium]
MKPGTIALVAASTILLTSCGSNEDFQQRMDKRNEAYSNYNDRRKIRTEARQERTDMWFERHMD